MVEEIKTAEPIIPKVKFQKDIEKAIFQYLYLTIFKPLIDVAKPLKYYSNSVDYSPLIQALENGQIQYVDSMFVGKFNAKISKILSEMGATFDKRKKAWKIEQAKIPVEVIASISASAIYWNAVRLTMINILENINFETHMPDMMKLINIPVGLTLDDVDEQFKRKILDRMTVRATLTPYTKLQLKKRWLENTEMNIKNFTEQEAKRLRELVQKNMFEGLENNVSLLKVIEKEFNVSANKARFLARNESENLISEYEIARAKEVGISQYVWLSKEDERVRPLHHKLNGQTIDFENPPIVSEKGYKRHAGQDYNCRCLMRMVLK